MCLMENNRWRALHPCICEGHEASTIIEMSDKLSVLPNEVLLFILSFLTFKEVVRTSLVSKKWRRWLSGYYPKFNFQDSTTMEKIWLAWKDEQHRNEMRSLFLSRVEGVIKQHLHSSIDDFRVAFDLDETSQSHIDNWVAFAFTKRVKNLELDFEPSYSVEDDELHRCGFTPEFCEPLGVGHALTSLSLKYINITSEVVESILLSCPFLENLLIEESEFLTSIKSPASSLPLKHLDVSRCNRLQDINISAPKLLSFTYFGENPIELNIENASSLSSVSIGVLHKEARAYAFESLSTYLPQLETLSLWIAPISDWKVDVGDVHLPLPHLPHFTKVKVLELILRCGDHMDSLLGWTPVIDACPILEKLTLQLNNCYDPCIDWRAMATRNGSPLKRLKTLELLGYRGRRGDIEFASFIFENAVMLQEVIVEVCTRSWDKIGLEPVRISKLKEKVPEGASFTLRESSEASFKHTLI